MINDNESLLEYDEGKAKTCEHKEVRHKYFNLEGEPISGHFSCLEYCVECGMPDFQINELKEIPDFDLSKFYKPELLKSLLNHKGTKMEKTNEQRMDELEKKNKKRYKNIKSMINHNLRGGRTIHNTIEMVMGYYFESDRDVITKMVEQEYKRLHIKKDVNSRNIQIMGANLSSVIKTVLEQDQRLIVESINYKRIDEIEEATVKFKRTEPQIV